MAFGLKGALKNAAQAVVARVSSGEGLPPATWDLTESAAGLGADGFDFTALLEKFGSPLHVVREDRVTRNAQRYLAVPRGASAGVEVFSSYKTNPVPGVLKLLHAQGIGAEVISAWELWLALQLGVPAEKIVYNGPAKSLESVREAVKRGIALLGANHVEELEVFASVARELNQRPKVAVRVAGSHGWTAQFGSSIPQGTALQAMEKALSLSELEVVGLHAHRGGMIRSESELLAFVDEVLGFCEQLFEKFRFTPSVLDFGGSLGCPTVAPLSDVQKKLNSSVNAPLPAPKPSEALSIERYLELLVGRVEAHFQRQCRARPRIFVEPGRSLTSDTQLLLTSVMTVKGASPRAFAVLDAGINHAECVRSEYHQLFVASPPATSRKRYTLVGPICTPADWLYASVELPELKTGDALAIMDTGAYFVPFSTSFSFPRPAIVAVKDGQVRVLRRAERFRDLISLDDV